MWTFLKTFSRTWILVLEANKLDVEMHIKKITIQKNLFSESFWRYFIIVEEANESQQQKLKQGSQ